MDTSKGRILSGIEDEKLKEAVAKGQVRLKKDPDENKTDIGSGESYPDGDKPPTDSIDNDQSIMSESSQQDKVD